MCGRYTIREKELIRAVLSILRMPFEEFSETRIVPHFNVAPSQTVPIVRLHDCKGQSPWSAGD